MRRSLAACAWPASLGRTSRSSRPVTPSDRARSSSRWSRSPVARASSRARWDAWWSRRRWVDSVPSLWLGTSSRSRRRDRAQVSIERLDSAGRPSALSAAFRKPRSKRTLWPTTTASPRNSRREGRTASIWGASTTMDSVIPVSTVMDGGIPQPGSTRVWKVPSQRPPRRRTAPTSVIAQPSGDVPVVSRSTTQNGTSVSGRPRSSRLVWKGPATGERPIPLVNRTNVRSSSHPGRDLRR